MDIYAAQHVFGRGRNSTASISRWRRASVSQAGERALRRALGPGFEVQTPAARGQSFQSMLRIYRLMLRFSSVAALVVGMFIIYNAFAIAVTQRRGEIGHPARARRDAAADRGALPRRSCLGGLVRIRARRRGRPRARREWWRGRRGAARASGLVGVSQGAISVAIEPWLIALAMVIGVVTSTMAAALPARNGGARRSGQGAAEGPRRRCRRHGTSRARAIAAACSRSSGAFCSPRRRRSAAVLSRLPVRAWRPRCC